MKKIRVLLIAICILMGTIGSYLVFADETASISVSDVTGNAGDTVSVTVSLSNLKEVASIKIKISYDTDKLKLVSVSDTGFLKESFIHPSKVSTSLSWGAGTTKCNTGASGAVAVLKFKMLDGFTSGKTTVSASVWQAIDMDLNTISFTEKAGQVSVKAHKHEYGDWKVTKEATCTQQGEKERVCSSCKEKQTAVIEKTGHTVGKWETIKEPTCTEAGEKKRSCTTEGCTYVETAKIDAKGHTYNGKEVIVKEATCEEKGSKKVFCSVESCRAYKTVDISAKGHVKGETKVEKEATCTEKGKKVTLCKECNAEISTETIKALGHKFGKTVEEKEASCTEDGYGYQKCEREGCQESKKVDLKKLGHKFGKEVVERKASCTEDGYGYKPCERCDEKQEIKYEKLGHEYGKAVISVEPTCTEPGTSYKPCIRCEESQDDMEVPALGHEYGELVVETKATCIQTGSGHKSCVRCTDTQLVEIPALGHKYSESTVVKEATLTEEGESQAVCEVCGDSITEIWPKLSESHEHKFAEEQTMVEEATCAQKGISHIACTVEGCGAYKILETPAKSHTFGEWIVTKEATEEEEGTKERTCSVCHNVEKAAIEKLPVALTPELPDEDTWGAFGEKNEKDWITMLAFGAIAILGVIICVICFFNFRKK